jgi:hypothetical protein
LSSSAKHQPPRSSTALTIAPDLTRDVQISFLYPFHASLRSIGFTEAATVASESRSCSPLSPNYVEASRTK